LPDFFACFGATVGSSADAARGSPALSGVASTGSASPSAVAAGATAVSPVDLPSSTGRAGVTVVLPAFTGSTGVTACAATSPGAAAVVDLPSFTAAAGVDSPTGAPLHAVNDTPATTTARNIRVVSLAMIAECIPRHSPRRRAKPRASRTSVHATEVASVTSHRDPLANLDLPGVFRCLARDGHLDPTTPAVRELVLRFAGPEAMLFRTVGERIDQIGWPVVRDLEVALAAFAHLRVDHSLADELARAARAVIAGDRIDRKQLARLRARLDMLALIPRGHTVLAVVALAAQIHRPPDAGLPELVRSNAAWAAAHPTHAAALAHLAGAMMGGIDGWLAYEAHRRLPSTTAEASALVVAAALAVAGRPLLDELIALALRLVAT
jgi:hypothetical protein